MRRDDHGWVQLHHHPREPTLTGRGCGRWKRPASGCRAEGMRAEGEGDGGGRRGQEVGDGRWQGWRGCEVRGRHGQCDSLGAEWRSLQQRLVCPETWVRGRAADSCGSSLVSARGEEVLRWGEAENPGPPGAMAGREGSGGMTVEEAWEVTKNDPQWTPAWKLWSRQVVTGTKDGKLDIVLRSPHEWEAGEDEERHGVWEEEELEAFLQQCELEAGWRDSVDGAQGARLAQEWREWETEMATAGIDCPRLEEGEAGGEAAQGGVEVEVMEPPPPKSPGTGGEKGRGGKQRRRRLRPMQMVQSDGEPSIEEVEKEGEVAGAIQGAMEERAVAEAVAAPPQAQARRTGRSRPRGRRQRGAPAQDFVVDVVTFNGSGAPQLLEAMGVLAGNKASLAALLVQEHHASGDSLADLQAGARARGLKLAPCEATEGKGGGWSAGVGVAAPTHRGWGGISAPRWDFSPAESPGRLAGAWLQAGPRGGMVVLSIYCWASEGMSARNVALVCKALEVASACGSAWLIGGDFNVTPSELVATAGGMLDRAGAEIRAPLQPTCYPAAGRARTLDYFLVDARAAAAISQAEVVEEVAGSPHRAVRVKVSGREVGGLVRMIRKPRMFPRQRPVGCPRRPLVPRGEAGEGEGQGGEVSLEEEWRRLAYCIEGELARECDLVGGNGEPDKGYLGRGEGMNLVLRPLMPPRNVARHGRADGRLHRLIWTLNRLEELAHLAGKRRAGWGEDNRRMQWERIVFALVKRDGCTTTLAETDEEWAPMLTFLDGLRGRPMQGGTELGWWATRVREAVDEHKWRMAADRIKAWREWVAGQIRRGGGALHSFTKRVMDPPEETIVVEEGRTGSPQAHVEADLAEWNKTWQKLAGVAKAPWRDEVLGTDEAAVLPTPTPKEMRISARRFKVYTGVGSDLFRPHWFSWLSDPLLGKLAALLARVEGAGRWPGQVMTVLVHLIPKEGGGRRPIGLLASLVRWWERLRAPAVQRWRLEHARPFNWAAPGRSAEKAVWDVSLRDEAAMARGMCSAATLVDLVKAFEHIPLEALWARGREHGFPLKVLRLVLELCSAVRRLVFRGAVSQPTSTLTAVIAGLVAAIDCMHLVVVNVLDGLRKDYPQLRVIAYVDDLTLHRAGTEQEVKEDLEAATAQLVRELENSCRLVVSRVKSGVVASTKQLVGKLKRGMGRIGIGVTRRARLLGVDYQPGKGRGGGGGKSRESGGRESWVGGGGLTDWAGGEGRTWS